MGRRLQRLVLGTPIDHPSVRQLAAEVEWLDEQRYERGRESRERLERLRLKWRAQDEMSA